MNIKDIKKSLLNYYLKDLYYPKVQDKWNKNNKYFGMYAITSLIINDYFGGYICKIHVNGISHYFNLIEDKIIDLTADQFNCDIDYNNYDIINRENILNEDTSSRYTLLKERLTKQTLKEKLIQE